MDISPATWPAVSSLLDEALGLAPAERDAWINNLERTQPALAPVLKKLLRAHASSETADVLNSLPTLDVAAATGLASGAQMGPYRLKRELGSGGMADVWLAERADGAFERDVALKLPRLTRLRGDLAMRFAHERDILARLEHPQIARFYDAGVSADGTSYLAMEYVDGLPITRWCDERRLDSAGRLRLFAQVLDAVQFAHASLVVHRDLKPTNILVTNDGQVRLLDFGIAKLLSDGEIARETQLTQLAGRALTPDYASPEQIRGEPLTIATDVYSLGVVLFELLAGQLPYRLGGLRSAAQLEQAIVATDPPRPSGVVSSARAELHGVSQKRLVHVLRGDLDTIVLKALKKEPERRYRSVEALRGDIDRYLRREPIQARPDTLLYRTTRFVQRHAAAVGAGVLVAMSILAGVAGVIWQSRVASEQARRAEAATTFMAGVFRLSDPGESRGETLRAREILDIAARRIDTELAGTPALQADMLSLVGRIYMQLGMYANARPLLERGLSLRQRIHPSQHIEIGDSLDALGTLQSREGKYADSERTLTAALATLEATSGVESAEYASALQHLAETLNRQARFEKAEETARRALAVRKALFGEQHPAVAESLMLLAELRRSRGNFKDAIAFDRQALDVRRAHFGNLHPDVIQSLSSLALGYYDLADYPASEKLYAQALAAARQTLGADHPDTLQAMNDLATVLAQEGRLAESEPLLREALAARRRRLGDAHPTLVITLNALAGTVRRLGRGDEAAGLYREALSIAERALGPNHLEVAKNLNDLGTLLQERGELAEAESMIRRSLPILAAIVGEQHWFFGRALTNLASVQFNRGALTEAEAGFRRALAILRKSLPGGHTNIARVAVDLGRTLVAQNKLTEAEPLLRESLATLTTLFGAADPRTIEASRALDVCLLKLAGASRSGPAAPPPAREAPRAE
jgi:eukaryotic-like serine/threonine-protein kinase